MKTFFTIVAIILTIDLLGFIFWCMSGQYPEGSFYIGTLTTQFLRGVIF